MSILLVVAVGTEAGIAVLLGTFMAGSQARRNLIWAGCLVAMGLQAKRGVRWMENKVVPLAAGFIVGEALTALGFSVAKILSAGGAG